MITTFKDLENGAIQIGDSFIEVKLIGAILYVGQEGDTINVELQLKNAKYTRLKISSQVRDQLVELWLGELDRKNSEKERCETPRPTLRDSAREYIDRVLTEELIKRGL